jgi:hypothetical protein
VLNWRDAPQCRTSEFRLAHCWVLDANRARDRERAQCGNAVCQIAEAPAKKDAGLDSSVSAKLTVAARQSPAEPGREQRFMEIIAEEQPLKPDLRRVKPSSIRDATAGAIYPVVLACKARSGVSNRENAPSIIVIVRSEGVPFAALAERRA